ncbi:MAG: acyl-CoA dehydrogenase family protein [Solirubrobacteraceae bacterium]|nr:acyl-CoA dehydrogenase family protein [Solirubrobacteraceae bacterium]
MKRTLFEDIHDDYRETVRAFIAAEITPHHEQWEEEGCVPRELFVKAAEQGLLATAVPEEYGGLGMDDFRLNQVVTEEISYACVIGSGLGISLHNDVCLPYFLEYCTPEQRERWLPGIASGELITAVAMTEPGIGSDLASMNTTAIKQADGSYVVNGAKTFITNGLNADLIITAVKTDPTQKHKGMSLVIIEGGMKGFERGRNLHKLGLHAQDTAELFFNDVVVPPENLLGTEGAGFMHLVHNLAQERLSIAVTAVSAAQGTFNTTLQYVKEREAFGKPIGTFQNSRFKLAEMATELEIATVYTDRCTAELNAKTLSAESAAMAKWWATEMQGRVMDQCVQLHGGYGYMLEYPVTRAFADARITRIYGGTTEIMKEIVGKSLGV